MEILIAIAANRCVRLKDIRKTYGPYTLDNFASSDRAGLTIRWLLGPTRGYAFALNPHFSLTNELRRLLVTLSREYPVRVKSDARVSDAKIPRGVRGRDERIDLLFGSSLKTRTLAALEVFGGSERQALLWHAVPGEFANSVKTLAKRLFRDGILQRKGENIVFASRPWTRELRAVLKAYIKQNPGFKEAVAAAKRVRNVPRRLHHAFGLFGPGAMERTLTALAINGPMSYVRLLAAARTSTELALRSLERDGLVASVRSGRSRTVGLNAAHPIYRELLALLASFANARFARSSVCVPRDRDEAYGISSLFTTELRLDLLLTVASSQKGEIDAASVGRVLPEYDGTKIFKRLHAFENEEILLSQRWKTLLLYRLNPDYAHYAPLVRLLKRIAVWRPETIAATRMEEALYPPRRKAMHVRKSS